MNNKHSRTGMVELYDTTLRDGAQTKGVHFSLSDKLAIIELLDDFGIDIIEAGWNGANVTDTRLFRELGRRALNNSRIAAFCSSYHPSRSVDSDPVFSAGTAVDVPVMTLFGKSWDFQVSEGLKIPLERNVDIIAESLAYCRRRFDTLIFDAEHFFDGLETNPDYSLAVVAAALDAGADRVVLCDTNGGRLPWQIRQAVDTVRNRFPDADLGIHGHNDADTAVANSLAAVEGGVFQVQGTINGVGERCGNTNLCSLIPNLALKCGYRMRFVTPDRLAQLRALSSRVAEVMQVPVTDNQPYVGDNAFTHKAGVHIASVLRHPGCYEHIEPQWVGHRRQLVISEQSGRVAIRHKLEGMGYGPYDEATLRQLVEEIKRLASQGYSFDRAEVSLELLIHDMLGGSGNGPTLDHLSCESLPGIGAGGLYRIELALSFGGKLRFRRQFSEHPVATIQGMLLELMHKEWAGFESPSIHQVGSEVLDSGRQRAWVSLGPGGSSRAMVVSSAGEQTAQCLAIAESYRWAWFSARQGMQQQAHPAMACPA